MEGAAAPAMASPSGQYFEGAYAVVFDLWMNVNGPLPGGVGDPPNLRLAGIAETSREIMFRWPTMPSLVTLVSAVTGRGGLPGISGAFWATLPHGSPWGTMAGSQDAGHPYYATFSLKEKRHRICRCLNSPPRTVPRWAGKWLSSGFRCS